MWLALLAALSLCACNGRQRADVSWAITHVSVVDVKRGSIATDQTIYIREDRVAAVTSAGAASLPPNIETVDASGEFAVPGLFNMHAHGFCDEQGCGSEPHLSRYVSAGVVGIRDMGAPLDGITRVAKDMTLERPAIWFVGPILDGRRGQADPTRVTVESADQARSVVLELKRSGVQFVKVHDWLTRPTYLAVAAAAREQHLPLVGHLPAAVSVEDALMAGQASIEHMGGLAHGVLRACSRPDPAQSRELERRSANIDKGAAYQLLMSSAYITPMLDSFDETTCAALSQQLARAHVWQVPTLVLWRSWAESRNPTAANSVDIEARGRLYETYRRIVALMYSSGVRILAGTDEIPGTNVQDELELLASAGMPPAAVLQAATTSAADFLGVSDSYGAIAPGQFANLILVRQNPLSNIRSLRDIQTVVLRGKQIR